MLGYLCAYDGPPPTIFRARHGAHWQVELRYFPRAGACRTLPYFFTARQRRLASFLAVCPPPAPSWFLVNRQHVAHFCRPFRRTPREGMSSAFSTAILRDAALRGDGRCIAHFYIEVPLLALSSAGYIFTLCAMRDLLEQHTCAHRYTPLAIMLDIARRLVPSINFNGTPLIFDFAMMTAGSTRWYWNTTRPLPPISSTIALHIALRITH